MCSQADDPSQHGSEDTQRAALDIIEQLEYEGVVRWGDDGHRARFLAALAASATDEGPQTDEEWLMHGARPALAASATDEPERHPLIPTDEELRAMWEALPPRFAASATERQHCPCCDGSCT